MLHSHRLSGYSTHDLSRASIFLTATLRFPFAARVGDAEGAKGIG